ICETSSRTVLAALRRAADLHAILRAGRHHRPAAISNRQQLARRRQPSLPQARQRWHRRRIRLGLIVPVLKNADELNFLGLQRGITDLGERARTKKLMPADVEGATFTITNPGQFGAVFGLPIINQPNAAIMGVGGITKQPLVITDKDGTDSIAIRSVVHLTL